MSDIRDLISAYADGTATPEERARVEQLAAEQPEVAREILWMQVARQMLAEKCRSEAPEELFTVCMSRVREIDRRQRTERTVTRMAPVLCGALCLAIIGAGVLNRNQNGNTLGANQVASLMTGGAAVRERCCRARTPVCGCRSSGRCLQGPQRKYGRRGPPGFCPATPTVEH